jgi:phage repressor protein C with HTH and peptisase S24 domain
MAVDNREKNLALQVIFLASVYFSSHNNVHQTKYLMNSKTNDKPDAQEKKKTQRPFHDESIGRFPERLEMVMAGRSAREFSRLCGISDASVRDYLRGDSYPSLDRLDAIAAAADVSAQWLATGKGSADLGIRESEGLYTSGQFDEFALVPVYDIAASAGHGSIAEDSQPLRDLAFRRDWLISHGLLNKLLAVIEVKGDSMTPTLSAGDTILVDMTDTEIGVDAIYVLRMNDHLYAKRLQRGLDGSVRVISDNPAYQNQIIEEGRLQDLHVVGRVVWGGRFFV